MQGGQYERVIKEAEIGCQLCDNFTFELLKPEAVKMHTEFSGIKLKAEAR